MKRIGLIILFGLNLSFLLSQSGIDGWVYIFIDDFDGSSLKDEYYHLDYPGSVEHHDYTCMDMDPDNFLVANGILRLLIYHEDCVCNDDGIDYYRDYKQQSLRTIRNYKFGRFKIRAEIGKTSAFFPAFWWHGGSKSPYLKSTEIDFFEIWTLMDGDEAASTIYRTHPSGLKHKWQVDWNWTPNDWYTYECEWLEEHVKIYYNENNVVTFSIPETGYPDELNPWGDYEGNGNVMISNQLLLGNGTGHQLPTGDVSMYIDYFTIMYPIDVDEIVTIDDYEIHAQNEEDKTVFSGKEIYVSPNNGSVVIKKLTDNPWHDPSRMDLFATDKIVFKPGFHAEEGTEMNAWIVSAEDIVDKDADENEFIHNFSKYVIYPDEHESKSDIDSYSVTGIDEDTDTEVFQNLIDIYPNPVTDFINVKLGGSEMIEQVIIINMEGEILFEQQYSSNYIQADLSALMEGNYVITVKTNKQVKREFITKL
ncbi:MAG: family 16 glycosylhydrolase [Bacteroidales bacterium]|nr:family 16 glycosylhydrolase [Bacteroidales bacterium]